MPDDIVDCWSLIIHMNISPFLFLVQIVITINKHAKVI